MTTSSGYLLHCALTLPLVGGLGVLVGGQQLGVSAVVCGAVLLGNLVVSERLTRESIASIANGHPPQRAYRPVMRQLTTLPLALFLILYLGATAVALGLATVVLGLFLHLTVQAIHDAGEPVTTLASALESRC